MALTNPNRVITVERLGNFYQQLLGKFLQKTDADTYYAKINGANDQPFNAENLTISDKVSISFIPAVAGVPGSTDRLVLTGNDDEIKVNIPLVDSTMATVDQVEGKADVVKATNNVKFCLQPHIQVFYEEYDGNAQIRLVPGRVYFYKSSSGGSVVPKTASGFSSSNYFYYAIDTSTVVRINPVSPYVIYYNVSTQTLCRWDSATSSFIQIATGSGGGGETPGDYEIATEEDINSIINTINGTTTNSETE